MTIYRNHHLNGDHAAAIRPRAGTYEDRTDAELMAMISAGESEALELLYKRYAGKVYQMVLRVVQEALQNVRKHAGAANVVVAPEAPEDLAPR